MPSASTTSPVTRTTRPCVVVRGSVPILRARTLGMLVRQAAVQTFERSIDAAIDNSVAAFDNAAAHTNARIRYPVRGSVRPVECAVQSILRGFHDCEIAGMHAYLDRLIERKLFERATYESRNDFRINREFAVDNVTCNCTR